MKTSYEHRFNNPEQNANKSNPNVYKQHGQVGFTAVQCSGSPFKFII